MRRPLNVKRKPASLRSRTLARKLIGEVVRERDSRGYRHRVYSCAREVGRYLPPRVPHRYPWRRWAWHGPQRTLAFQQRMKMA
jgi:hypothetical protein